MQIQLPEGKYKCIVADPPWPYGNLPGAGFDPLPMRKTEDGSRRHRSTREMGYDIMTMADLCAIPVRNTAEANAHLYLWTTNAFMREAHDLAEAWGFKVKTCLTWGKVKEDGTASMKTGYYFRGATEHCLFAVRGSLPLQVKHGKPTLYLSRRLPHSVKPDWFYALCEECSPGPRLELFSRRVRHGWTVWGNQINQDARAGQGECPGTACNSASMQVALDI